MKDTPIELEIKAQMKKINRIIDEIEELKSEEDLTPTDCNQIISVYEVARKQLKEIYKINGNSKCDRCDRPLVFSPIRDKKICLFCTEVT
jgi:hypothetical protein